MKMENGKLKMRKTQTSQTLAQRAQLLFLIYNLSFAVFNCYPTPAHRLSNGQ